MNIIINALLTPPLSRDGSEPPPFKPTESDNVSLSMKKPHKHRRRLDRACASSGDAHDESLDTHSPTHNLASKSMPNLNHSAAPTSSPQLSDEGGCAWVLQKLRGPSLQQQNIPGGSESPAESTQRTRRWTVPSKARPTHLVSNTNQPATLSNAVNVVTTTKVTPAMITLRRATTKQSRPPSISHSNITFFPPPQLNRKSTRLLSLLRMSTQQEPHDWMNISANLLTSSSLNLPTSSSPPRRPSISTRYASPCTSTIAEPAVTKIFEHEGFAPRRCSTKIVSGNNTHEIIWDENAVVSSNSNSPPSISGSRSRGNSRSDRPSFAVEKLELQIGLLNYKLNAAADTARVAATLQNLPRSRAGSGLGQSARVRRKSELMGMRWAGRHGGRTRSMAGTNGEFDDRTPLLGGDY